jgi:hypothetical protein
MIDLKFDSLLVGIRLESEKIRLAGPLQNSIQMLDVDAIANDDDQVDDVCLHVS